MAWDEATYGLEYDLDLFNIVAVDDFNMGAMENKSLNIFNSRWEGGGGRAEDGGQGRGRGRQRAGRMGGCDRVVECTVQGSQAAGMRPVC